MGYLIGSNEDFVKARITPDVRQETRRKLADIRAGKKSTESESLEEDKFLMVKPKHSISPASANKPTISRQEQIHRARDIKRTPLLNNHPAILGSENSARPCSVCKKEATVMKEEIPYCASCFPVD